MELKYSKFFCPSESKVVLDLDKSKDACCYLGSLLKEHGALNGRRAKIIIKKKKFFFNEI